MKTNGKARATAVHGDGEPSTAPRFFSDFFAWKKSEKICKEKSEKNGSIFSQIFCQLLSPGPQARSCPHCPRGRCHVHPAHVTARAGTVPRPGAHFWPPNGGLKIARAFPGAGCGWARPSSAGRRPGRAKPPWRGLVCVAPVASWVTLGLQTRGP